MQIKSYYIHMLDGTRLAVSVWLSPYYKKGKGQHPAILTTTRYWHANIFKNESTNPPQQFYDPHAKYFWQRGYCFVVADARGSGASFGKRTAEISSEEVKDMGELIDWVAAQPWCDGRVVTNGTSYTANTAIHSLASKHPALKVAVCRAPDFDLARHLIAPGGIDNHWFRQSWGALTRALDQQDLPALKASAEASEDQQAIAEAEALLGVRPVDQDKDGALLKAALAEHTDNFNVADAAGEPGANNRFGSNPYNYQTEIEQSNTPLVIRCGWHDAATALGALSLFCTFKGPIKIVLGPWSHNGSYRLDPFELGNGQHNEPIALEDELGFIADTSDTLLDVSQPQTNQQNLRAVEYYTLGENRWKTTPVWPLPNIRMQRFYLDAHHQLSANPPACKQGSDLYQVDPSTSSGVNNRWGCQMKLPVYFDDRREQDKQRLVYDSLPLEQDTEITGHPVITLFIRSSATDGQLFVYLETLDPDGRVRWLTDGQLRLKHRKVSLEEPPFKMFGPYHSLTEEEAEPLIPGKVTEISFDLLPISVLLKKGQRLRLAIAGADSGIFPPVSGSESPEITLERNAVYASFIDLPLVPITES